MDSEAEARGRVLWSMLGHEMRDIIILVILDGCSKETRDLDGIPRYVRPLEILCDCGYLTRRWRGYRTTESGMEYLKVLKDIYLRRGLTKP